MVDLILDDSDKFHNAPDQFAIRDQKFVYFRVVNFGDSFVLKTATASDDRSPYRVVSSPTELLDATAKAFDEAGFVWSPKNDRNGRPYIEAKFEGDLLGSLITDQGEDGWVGSVLMTIVGLFQQAGSSVVERNEMKDLYQAISVNDGEKVYFGDGMYLTPEGRLIED